MRSPTVIRWPVLVFFLLPFLVTFRVAADDHELLDEEERQWVESLERPLFVGSVISYRPYDFVDDAGELSGVVGDYMRMIGDRLDVEYSVKSYPTFADMLTAARNREIDIAPLIVAAPERKAFLDFTQPAYETQDRILTRNDMQRSLGIDDLIGMKVGVVEGYAKQAEIEANHPEIILDPVATEVDGLLALSLGRIDAFIVEVGTSSYYIQEEAITNLRVAGMIEGRAPQSIGTRNDWPMLNRIIAKGLASITPDEHADIRRRWIAVDGGVSSADVARIWQRVGVISAIVFGGLIGMLVWTMSLRRLVARRTDELQQELEKRRRIEAVKERLAVAVEQSVEYVLVTDMDGNIEYANLSFAEASGISDIEGQRLESLTENSSRETLSSALLATGKGRTWRGPISLARGPRGAMKVSMTIAPIYDANNEMDGLVVTARDVTHEEELQSQLRQSEKLSSLGTLAGGIAHDFNNLLMPIFGYVELLSQNADERAAQYIDGILDASVRARDLVRQILIFGRSGGGRLEALDLGAEIADSKTLLDSVLPPKVELRLDLNACAAVMCDKSQLQQILVNLCSNASDAMSDQGGVINIGLEEMTVPDPHVVTPPDLAAGQYNVLTVSDSGEGMNADTIARIFDPYFTDKPLGKGTGLGLAIVHGIVTSHGGAIQVESSPGIGTSVIVYFPAVDGEPVRRKLERRDEIQHGKGEHVLVLDDDELVLSTIEKMLQHLGYKADAWSDASAALEALRKAPDTFDAIVADFKMPRMTGLEFAEQVREIQPDIAVVIMSGNPDGLQGKGFDYIVKPLSLDDLAKVLSKALA